MKKTIAVVGAKIAEYVQNKKLYADSILNNIKYLKKNFIVIFVEYQRFNFSSPLEKVRYVKSQINKINPHIIIFRDIEAHPIYTHEDMIFLKRKVY